MYSAHKQGKPVVTERFMKTSKSKISNICYYVRIRK